MQNTFAVCVGGEAKLEIELLNSSAKNNIYDIPSHTIWRTVTEGDREGGNHVLSQNNSVVHKGLNFAKKVQSNKNHTEMKKHLNGP